MANEPKLTRDQQREAARAKARELREKHKAAETRKKVVIQVSVVVAVLAVIGVIVMAMTTSPQTKGGSVPKVAGIFNEGGIKVGTNLEAFTASNTPTATPTPGSTSSVPNIKVYLDYQCPFCQQFEAANNAQITDWVKQGTATIEIHPISFLDGSSLNAYSSRAANAAYCVAEKSPNTFYEFNAFLFANQPAEGSAGPDNNALYEDAANLHADNLPAIKSCIDGNDFGKWIGDNTTSLIGPDKKIPETENKLEGTPFVLVNNQQYTYTTPAEQNDPARFSQFVQTVSSAE
jgi:protein-disulfide isomerase